ncbi:hypothetical protein OV450_8548 [Actinobacteria bacterium OV450]|nr:hypothetical protein OV450_8548 [Actinobacteria bacterium OV450]
MTTHILAGLGTASSSYSPAVTAAEQEVTFDSSVVFVPPLSCADAPLRLLASDELHGTIVTRCTGSLADPDIDGTLHWLDGTTSAYTITSLTAERVQGHVIAHDTGTITSGHYTGGTIHRLGIRLAGNVTACLAGGSISSSVGTDLIFLTTS